MRHFGRFSNTVCRQFLKLIVDGAVIVYYKAEQYWFMITNNVISLLLYKTLERKFPNFSNSKLHVSHICKMTLIELFEPF